MDDVAFKAIERVVNDCAFSDRARTEVINSLKKVLDNTSLPLGRVYVVKRKSWLRKLLGIPKQEMTFEYRILNWQVDKVFIENAVVYVILAFRYEVICQEYAIHVTSWDFRAREYEGPNWPPSNDFLNQRSAEYGKVCLGVEVIPLNSQQARYVLKRDSAEVWGNLEDLVELRSAPEGLLCTQHIHI